MLTESWLRGRLEKTLGPENLFLSFSLFSLSHYLLSPSFPHFSLSSSMNLKERRAHLLGHLECREMRKNRERKKNKEKENYRQPDLNDPI
jgi:hypothetical protein